MTTIKKALVLLGIGSLVFVAVPAAPAYAKDGGGGGCNPHFLSFPTWYRGLTNSDCSIKDPGEMGISNFIWKIALNVLEILLQLVAYVSVGFVIYGGFLYLTSAGSSDKITAGRKTILNAIIGLVLSFFSVVIVALVAGNIK